MPIYKSDKPTKDGRKWFFKVSYVDAQGYKKRYESKKYMTKSEASISEANFMLNLDERKVKDVTVDVLFKNLVESKKGTIKPQSLSKLYNIYAHIQPHLGSKVAEKLTKLEFDRFKNSIKKELSTDYKNKILRFVKVLYTFGVRHYGLKNNVPFLAESFKDFGIIKTEQDFFTYDEYQLFREQLPTKIWRAYFDVLYFCGLRKNEANALNWNDIDFVNNTINVNKNLVNKIKGVKYLVSSPKTKSSYRKIPMPKAVQNSLKEVYEYFKTVYLFNEDWFVFGGIKPLCEPMIDKHKNRACKKANLKQIRVHDFRHSCASLLINNGANITLVAKYLGHSNIETTLNIYSHMFKSELTALMTTIDNLEK